MRSPRAIPVSAPLRVRDRLRAAPDGPRRVVHRGPDAVYVDVDGWCVGVLSANATAVPCGLRSRNPHLTALPRRSAYLRGGVLHLDGTPLVAGRVLSVSAPRLDLSGASSNAAGSTTQVIPPATVVGLAVPVDGPPAGSRAWAELLVGRGDGLTPAGDDLLCGWLAMHRAAGVATPGLDAAVRALSPRTTLLSATLLDCAIAGEVLPEYAAWLRALGTPDEPGRAAALAAVGHTSGQALLLGGRLALAALAPAPAPALAPALAPHLSHPPSHPDPEVTA
ncbi:MAG: DUF2877 domain-containing protein [Nocardioides sp.]